MNSIYFPAEDSYLLSDVLKNLKLKNIEDKKILDMGSGTGIQAETLINVGANPKNLTLIDINPESIKYLKKHFSISKIIQSDLFSKINSKQKFDIIVFNPPYLPENPDEPLESRIATTGGKIGSEIINKFLKQAKKHLNTDGKIYLLTSSLTKNVNWNNFKKKKIASKKLFFEELFVFELKK